MLRCVSARAVLALAVLWAYPAGAQDSETWRYQCLGDEVAGSRICTTELAVFEEGVEFIVYFVHTSQGKPPLVVSGEDEAVAGASVKVDKNEPFTSESCEAGACFFSAPDSKALMTQFRKGFRAKITLQDGDARVLFDRVLSLRGFSKALIAPPG